MRHALGDRTVARVEWRGVTADDKALYDAVTAMLRSELTVDQAVQVALLSNRTLQASYEDLGIAQADLVQAGLLHNPVFDLALRWPDESPRTVNIEFDVVADFLDIFFIPARKRIAQGRYDATALRVADRVVDLAADVKEAFYDLQAAQQSLEMRQTIVSAASAAAEMARRLHEAGNIPELERAEHAAFAAQSELALKSAEAEVRLARHRLGQLMGIAGSSEDWRIALRLSDLPVSDPDTDKLLAEVPAQRLDLRAARREAESFGRAARLTDVTRYLDDVEVGVSAEREVEGTWLVGPVISAPLPLFDQGQASLAAARARFRQSGHRYLAALNDARAEALAAVAQLDAAREAATHIRDVVLPLRAIVLEQAQRQYNAMHIGVFELLAAKREQVAAGKDYIDAMRQYWIARAQLEKAVGAALPAPTTATLTTASAPATQTTEPPPEQHQHHHH